MNKIVKPNRVVVKKVDGEWQARVYVNGKFDEDKTYFAMDKQDAEATARDMRARMNLGGLGAMSMGSKHLALAAGGVTIGALLMRWWLKRVT